MVELRVPNAGESITEVQIGAWLKREGQAVQRDEPVVEIETDKASMSIPAPSAGVLVKVLKKPGDSAGIGEVIATIDPTAVPVGEQAAPSAAVASSTAPRAEPAADRKAEPAAGQRVMPAAQRVLSQAGLTAADVKGTGPGGRVLKEDALRAVEQRSADRPPAAAQSPAPPAPAPARVAPSPSADGRFEELVPMTMLRRRIAERLVEAQAQAALLTTFNEIDMSAVMQLRKEHVEAFQKKYGVKLGFMSFFVKAAIDALKMIPAVNAEIRTVEVDGRPTPHIVYKNHYDIGVAVSTEQGLVVPVIRNAERLSFAEVELAIEDLAQRARARKLAIEELQGGTFTISNGGVFGSLMSTPIINPPQSAILGLHAIQDRPVAREGQVVIRPMMYVALTYDHRIIDGRESVTFLKRIKECVEYPTRMLIEV